jgi:signal transduction histidine kinase/CheY-like chemotaxis protein
MARLIGSSPDRAEELVERWLDYVVPEDQQRLLAAQDAAPLGGSFTVEYRARRLDGVERTFVSRGVRTALDRLVGVVQDVTELRAAERRQKETAAALEKHAADADAARRLWADVVEASDAGIQVVDAELRLVALNRTGADQFRRRFGASPRIGAGLGDLLSAAPERRAHVLDLWRRALAGESFMVVEACGEADRGGRWYEIKFSPLHDPLGRLIGACHLSADVTDRVRQDEALARAQAQLFESQKLETIGQLTGGVAHDFNNLLSAVMAHLHLAKKHADPRTARLIDGALQGAERGAALTGRLLAFARRQDLKTEAVALSGLFSGMKDLLERSVGVSVGVVADFPPDLPPVFVDPNQLELAILNLAVNARDAMPFGGLLTIEAKPATVDAETEDGLRVGAYVRLRISDTGQGMDEPTLKRATEPFFTTKGVGKGTGLGLPMVQGLAAQSGGALRIESQPGLGTTVELWLRQAEVAVETVRRPAAQPAREQTAGPTLTVLVVDDDTLVAMGSVAMLEDMGHAVLEAHGGPQALEEIARRPEIDVVLTDHAMPGMTGLELAGRIKETRPELPIVLATGYAELPNGEECDLPRLSKPFGPRELEVVLRAVTRQSQKPPLR